MFFFFVFSKFLNKNPVIHDKDTALAALALYSCVHLNVLAKRDQNNQHLTMKVYLDSEQEGPL